MFNKKPRRNFRQRRGESSEEDEQKNREGDESKTQTSDSSTKPSKLPQSRWISCSSKREATPPKSDSSAAEDAVEDSDRFADSIPRHKNERKQKGTVLSFSEEREVEGSQFKLKKSSDKAVVFQARKKESSKATTSRPTARRDVTVVASPRERSGSDGSGEALSPESDGDDDDGDDDDDVKSTTSSLASSQSSRSSVRKPVVFPNAKRIKEARRQRQEARTHREYIPLGRDDRDSSHGSHGSPEDPEREIRGDEDDDDEPDDHERRIQFAPRPKSIRERIAEKLGGSEHGHSDSDSEEREDQNLWEEQQIGKGVKRLQGEQSPGSDVSASSRSGRKKKVQIPKFLPPVSIGMLKKRITGKLDSLREVHRAREAELRRMEGDMESARTALENLEDGSSDRQLQFYRDMNLYVGNLVECLREKVVDINSVEVDMHTLLSDQAEALLSRRREAVRQESTRLQQLSYATDPKSEGDSEENANDNKDEAEDGTEEDYGRPPADSEPSPEEEEEVQKKRAEILSRTEDLFADVQEEFADVKRVLSRFAEWRSIFSESYHSAYISLCLPKLLNPLIRYQLIGWSPLQSEGEDFEALPWYSAVETFCHGQGYEEADNPDKKTLPAIIEKTLLPKIQGYVELVWDPLSSRQTTSLTELCRRLQYDYSVFEGEQSKPVKGFIEAISGRLRNSVDEDVFIPIYPKKFLDDISSPQCRFRDQQFWTAVKLLGNMALWDRLVPEHVLKELMLDKLLNRYLMMTLLNQPHAHDSVHKCKKVAECFPTSWFKDVSSPLPQLQSLSKHLLQTAHSVCKHHPDSASTRAVVGDILTVLGSIKSWDNATTIAEKYHYTDLLDTLNIS